MTKEVAATGRRSNHYLLLALLGVASVGSNYLASSFVFANRGLEEDPLLNEMPVTGDNTINMKPYPSGNGIQQGILSTKPPAFFQKLRDEIDAQPWQERCEKLKHFGVGKEPAQRRIFYGSLVGDEPWELFEIIATETYGIFEGMVFVESNRTQSFAPRPFRHDTETRAKLKELFGTPRLEVRQYTNEDETVINLDRENLQREEILKAWKDMGMTRDDIGYIADVDESFTRDFLRAIQTCPYVEAFDYETHKCHKSSARLKGQGRVYEGSPECVTKGRAWNHPDAILGACIEEIGDTTKHMVAKRDGYKRVMGFGTGKGFEKPGTPEYQKHYANVTGDHYPLWSSGDFRMQTGAISIINVVFHLHNWFADFSKTRHKYNTYGHAVRNAMTIPIHDIHTDLKLMAYCLRNSTDAPTREQKAKAKNSKSITETQTHQRVVGGLEAARKPWPIYFYDEDYRRRKHQAVQANLQADEQSRQQLLQSHERELETVQEPLREAKRQAWWHEREGRPKRAQTAHRKAEELQAKFQKLIQRPKAAGV